MTLLNEQDIEVAKDYLTRRLAAERSMCYNLEILMREAAERFVAVCYDAGLTPKAISTHKIPASIRKRLDKIVEWLKEAINDYFLELALYGHEEDKDTILPFILGRSYGKTFADRLGEYCRRYKDELLLLIGAGLYLGLTKSALATSIGRHLKKPYRNPELAEGIESPLTYGRGHTNSMYTAISGLTTFGISQAWMRGQYEENIKKGCIGWMVRRGSTYPCPICEPMVGFHEEEDELPPYHLNCLCYAVPVYPERPIL